MIHTKVARSRHSTPELLREEYDYIKREYSEAQRLYAQSPTESRGAVVQALAKRLVSTEILYNAALEDQKKPVDKAPSNPLT